VPGSPGQLQRQRGPQGGIGLLQQQFKRQHLQRIASQQRRGLAILHVHGRLAAAQHVVVHAGQVVVHQRVGVDQLDGARRAQHGSVRG